MGGRVDAAGESGDDRQPGSGQLPRERLADFKPVRVGLPGADDGDCWPSRQRASQVENWGWQFQVSQECGIVGVVDRQDPGSGAAGSSGLGSRLDAGVVGDRPRLDDLGASDLESRRWILREPEVEVAGETADSVAVEIAAGVERNE